MYLCLSEVGGDNLLFSIFCFLNFGDYENIRIKNDETDQWCQYGLLR